MDYCVLAQVVLLASDVSNSFVEVDDLFYGDIALVVKVVLFYNDTESL